jgi:Family of unknown function (DUF6221)
MTDASSEEEPVAWLRAAILARKAAAEAATPGPWEFEPDDEVFTVHDGEHGDLVGQTVAFTRHLAEANGGHIAANDPQDTIAGCEAELAILDEHYILYRSDTSEKYEQYSIISPPFPPMDCGCVTCHYASQGGVNGYGICRTVKFLASGYRHWPGFTASWPDL